MADTSIASESIAALIFTTQLQQLKGVSSKKDTNNLSRDVTTDTVDISPEAYEKLRQEQKEGANTDSPDETENPDASGSTEEAGEGASSPIAKLIEELKEKIAKLQEKIAELQGRKDEASQQQVEILKEELAAYMNQLMKLLQKQAEEEKASAS